MGFLKNIVKNSVSKAVNKAVTDTVSKKATQVMTDGLNKVTDKVTQPSAKQQQQQQMQQQQMTNSLNQAFGGFANTINSYATQATQNMKICPKCGTPSKDDLKFCPNCGTTLPVQTMAQQCVCTACGKQNNFGARFCGGCGAELPVSLAEKEQEKANMQEQMRKWDAMLANYPRWTFGGKDLAIEEDGGYVRLDVSFDSAQQAKAAMDGYYQLLLSCGFHQAGKYPSQGNLYNKIGEVCHLVSFENAFEAGSDYMQLYFAYSEPEGGYDYVKPEEKPKAKSILDFLK